MRIVDGEVGCVYRCSEFVAVRAVADEGADKTRAMGWLQFRGSIRVGQIDEKAQTSKHTNDSCTIPQKQVAVASSSLDQPSLAKPATGKYGFDLSTAVVVVGVEAMLMYF